MCVMALVRNTNKRPDQEMIEAMYNANSDGAGIAWQEAGKIEFRKGLDLKQISDLMAEVPTPYVAHFRVASIGGVSRRLTHPFLVTPDSELILEGSVEVPVLFHNGHIGEWRDIAWRLAGYRGYTMPDGKYNDSRALAISIAHYGNGLLEQFDGQRFIWMSPNDIKIYGGPWTYYHDSFYVSNMIWESRYNSRRRFHSATTTPEVVVAPVVREPIPLRTALEIAREEKPTMIVMGPVERTQPQLLLTDGIPEVTPAVNPFVGMTLLDYERKFERKEISKKALKRIQRVFYLKTPDVAATMSESIAAKSERGKRSFARHQEAVSLKSSLPMILTHGARPVVH